MKYNKYFTSQNSLAEELKNIVDNNIQKKISTEELKKIITEIILINKEKFYSENQIAFKIVKVLGKKRITIINKIISQI